MKDSIKTYGVGEPVVFTCLYQDVGEELYSAAAGLVQRPFTLAVFEVSDWNKDLSPFEGGADTLARLEVAAKAYDGMKYVAGYSMAGLFSLWSMYASSAFSGCACCSGSLWLPGWSEYTAGRSISPGSVYLSLGGKEEKTKDPLMATIGEKTRQQKALLEKDASVRNFKFEMNPGGHFSNPVGRMAKGIAWLLDNKGECR